MLKITPLNNPKLESMPLKEGFTISEAKADLNLHDTDFEGTNFIFESNDKGHLSLKAPKNSIGFYVGGEQLFHALIFPGMMFSIGEYIFAIETLDLSDEALSVESAKEKPSLSEAISQLKDHNLQNIQILKTTITFKFVRGGLLETEWKIEHAPISFGACSSMFFFIDDSLEEKTNILTLSLSSVGQPQLTPLNKKNIFINKEPLKSQKTLSNGDFVEFNKTAFYIYL